MAYDGIKCEKCGKNLAIKEHSSGSAVPNIDVAANEWQCPCGSVSYYEQSCLIIFDEKDAWAKPVYRT